LFVPLHVACYVRRWRRRPARSPLGTNDPQTRDLSFLDCWRAVCSFFLRHCIPGVEHYTHWIADGQTPERERERGDYTWQVQLKYSGPDGRGEIDLPPVFFFFLSFSLLSFKSSRVHTRWQ
jgi:hypothetical protein